MAAARICEPGGGGWFLPMFEDQLEWPEHLHGLVCATVMCYSFLGVSLVSDCFMAAIETITSARVQKTNKATGRVETTFVWNGTVATLTLMALGSSAPEIFLSLIDLVKKEFHFSTLGASTITGSAAFNLFIIVALCVMVIPSDEIRLILDSSAFYVTAVFSVLAYAWLWFIVDVTSPEVIEFWESLVTLLMLPVFVWVSYKVDVGGFEAFNARFRGTKRQPQVDESAKAQLRFEYESISFDAAAEEQFATVTAILENPHSQTVAVQYSTQPFQAVEGYDFEPTRGVLQFPPHTVNQSIQIKLLPGSRHRIPRTFLVVLDCIEDDNTVFNADTDGGDSCAILSVTINPLGPSQHSTERLLNNIVNLDNLRKGFRTWPEQFSEALFCNGSLEEQRGASCVDWVQHLLALPWKLLWAFIPPTCLFAGWLTFFGALVGIAFLCAWLSDLADMFGCVMGVPDLITAVTFVALGTSMPDLFASLSVAQADPTADAAIVNVTGSNSVNVYLGLGLPWTIGSLYWMIRGRDLEWETRYPELAAKVQGAVFVVNSGALGFTVLVFITTCTFALFILVMRRKIIGGELGGEYSSKVATCFAFVSFWLIFVSACSWRVIRWRVADHAETAMVTSALLLLMLSVAACPLGIMYYHRRVGGFERDISEAVQEPDDEALNGCQRNNDGQVGKMMMRSFSGGSLDSGSQSSKNSKSTPESRKDAYQECGDASPNVWISQGSKGGQGKRIRRNASGVSIGSKNSKHSHSTQTSRGSLGTVYSEAKAMKVYRAMEWRNPMRSPPERHRALTAVMEDAIQRSEWKRSVSGNSTNSKGSQGYLQESPRTTPALAIANLETNATGGTHVLPTIISAGSIEKSNLFAKSGSIETEVLYCLETEV